MDFKFEYNKQIIPYDIYGDGEFILVFVYGNTFGAKVFEQEVEFYKHYFRTVIFDYPGHGDSTEAETFPLNFWEYNSKVLVELIKHENLENVCLIGMSGGAVVALNAALLEPQLFRCVIADSLLGEKVDREFAAKVGDIRDKLKQNPDIAGIWKYFHGEKWERVIDKDTEMVKKFANLDMKFFSKDLSELKIPVLLTGSKKDDQISDMPLIIDHLSKKIRNSQKVLFESGFHPSMMSNNIQFREMVLKYFGII